MLQDKDLRMLPKTQYYPRMNQSLYLLANRLHHICQCYFHLPRFWHGCSKAHFSPADLDFKIHTAHLTAKGCWPGLSELQASAGREAWSSTEWVPCRELQGPERS